MNVYEMFDRMNYGRFFHPTRLTYEEKVAVTLLRIWPTVMDLNRANNQLGVVYVARNGMDVIMGDINSGYPCLMVAAAKSDNRNGDTVEAVAISAPHRQLNEKGDRHTILSIRPSWAIKKVTPHIKPLLENMTEEVQSHVRNAVALALDCIDSDLGRPSNAMNLSTTVEVLRNMGLVIQGKQTMMEVPPYIVSLIGEVTTKAEQAWDKMGDYRERANANVYGNKYALCYYQVSSDMRGKDCFFISEVTITPGKDRFCCNSTPMNPQWFRDYADLQERNPQLYNEIMPRLIMFKQARDTQFPNRYNLAQGAYNGPMDKEGFIYRNDYFVEAVGAMSYYRSGNSMYPQLLLLDKGA